MSKLSIGLVTSPSEESDQLIKLLEELGIEITYHISPDEIEPQHIQAENLSVWLLNVNDDDWHDNIDQLLDESEASIYFNEPGNLSKQSHPEYWCKNLVSRLYELTGIDESKPEPAAQNIQPSEAATTSTMVEQKIESQGDSLTSALDELETNSVGIPSEIAADLVSELETISPELEASIEKSSAVDDGLKSVHTETISPAVETIEIGDIVEPEVIQPEQKNTTEDKSLADEDLAKMEQVNLGVEEVEIELENSDLTLEDDGVSDSEQETATADPLTDDSVDELDISIDSSPDEQIDLLDDFDSELLDDSDLDFDSLELEDNSENDTNEALKSKMPSDLIAPETIESDNTESNSEFESEIIEPEIATPEITTPSDTEFESGQQEEVELLELESETADISDEIMQLADGDHTDSPSESQSKSQSSFAHDDIDLSVEVNPILESVRESNSKPAGSVFELHDQELADDEKSPESQNTVQDREQAIEFLSDFDTVTNDKPDTQDMEQSATELDVVLDQESAPSVDDGPEIDFELAFEADNGLETELDTELDFASEQELDLALSDAESQLDYDVTPETNSEQGTAQAEYEIGGLELESIEDNAPEKITGKAVFIDEQQQQEPASEANDTASSDAVSGNEFEMPSDGGLTLESIGDEPLPTTGKAQYVIDDELKDSDNQPEPSSNAQDTAEQVAETTEHLDISESVELEQAQAVELVDESFLELSEEQHQSDTTMTDDAAGLSDGLMDIDHELLDESEPESFEIPMLDDAATGLDFEEPSQPAIQKAELCSCWVIGASLGGPAAVKRFLQSLPKDINASFIITQHIDENFLPVLAEILTTSSDFEVKVANGSNSMSAGQIYLAPLNGKTIFLQDGSMLVDRSQKWSEPYSPCIDDVIESLSSVYKEKSGAIIFSGMGQDGLNGAKKMKALGGQIWAQSVDTCANPSMPDAVINEQLTDVVASPEMLAEQLASYLAS